MKRSIVGASCLLFALCGCGAEASPLPAAVAHKDRGMELRAHGEIDKAISEFDEAIGLAPDFATAYNERGLAWTANGESDKAIADFTEAIRLDPKKAMFYSNRGIVWKGKGDVNKAISDYDEAITLDPKGRRPTTTIGAIYGVLQAIWSVPSATTMTRSSWIRSMLRPIETVA